MPAVTYADYGVAAVADAAAFFSDLLSQASQIKTTHSIEPPLERTHLGDISVRLDAVLGTDSAQPAQPGAPVADGTRARQYAIIETAIRDRFARLVVSRRAPLASSPKERQTDFDIPILGVDCDRITRVCSRLEPARHSINPLGRRAM